MKYFSVIYLFFSLISFAQADSCMAPPSDNYCQSFFPESEQNAQNLMGQFKGICAKNRGTWYNTPCPAGEFAVCVQKVAGSFTVRTKYFSKEPDSKRWTLQDAKNHCKNTIKGTWEPHY